MIEVLMIHKGLKELAVKKVILNFQNFDFLEFIQTSMDGCHCEKLFSEIWWLIVGVQFQQLFQGVI